MDEDDRQEGPKFYKSAAGNPTIDRLDGGMSVGSGIFPIDKLINIGFDFDTTSGAVEQVVEHNLGYRPYVIGTYMLESVGSPRLLQDIPDPDYNFAGSVYIKDVKFDTLTLVVDITDSVGGAVSDSISFKLFLLNIPVL